MPDIIYPQLDGVKINEDRTLSIPVIQAIRKSYDYLVDINGLVVNEGKPGPAGPAGPPGPTGPQGPSDGGVILGPVTGFTSAGEVGTRYAADPDRIVHLTVGFIPICPTPQAVTYLISQDGANWSWIGSQQMLSAGQQLLVDQIAPLGAQTWKMACVAGNLGGDARFIPDSGLATLYPGVVRSGTFVIADLAKPPASQGITATIGAQQNILSADGFTQYGAIPGVVYTDPVGGSDFFVRITVQNYDSTPAALLPEQVHGGTQITGGTHTENALLITYIPNLAYMRYRFYVANRHSQGGGDFANTATNTLQMVAYNGNAPADHYDVPIVIPPFTPIDAADVFNVTSVTASEVGPKYQDEKQGLHTVVGIIPVIDHDYSKPRTVTIWIDYGDGKIVWQQWYSLTAAGQVIRIGDPTLGTGGVRKSGDIWVPANAANGNWVVYCGPNQINPGVDPHIYPHFNFTVTPVGPCSPVGTGNAQFLTDPGTGDPISYTLWDPGGWFWEYYELTFTPPSIASDFNYWFSLITVQKGATISGVWTPAPDSEGVNDDPTHQYLGRVHAQVPQIPGVSSDQVSVMHKFGAKPATWVIPPLQNPDMSTNIYREFRFLIYNVSRLGTDTSGSGGAGTYTLQTSCWPGLADHYILTPVPQPSAVDARALNPNTISAPLTGGNGEPLALPPYNPATGTGGINSAYIADQSITDTKMHMDAITAANGALAASSVVDPKIVSVGINKVTYGVSVFAGDVVLSRGISLPVIVLKNDGIYLFGAADSTNGQSGAITKPYIVVQSNAISLYQGDPNPITKGGSILVDAATQAITIYHVHGDTTQPYFTVNAFGMTMSHGTNTLALNSNYLTFLDTQFQNRIDVNSAGITLTNRLNPDGTASANAYQLVINAGAIQLKQAGVAHVTVDNTGVMITNGGSSSVQVTASTVAIVNGDITVSAAGQLLRMNPAAPSAPLMITRTTGGAFTSVAANDIEISSNTGNTVSITSTGIAMAWSGSGSSGFDIYGFNIITDVATHTMHTPYTGTLAAAISAGKNVSGGIIY